MPDGSIVLMGGNNPGYYLNDTWRSIDNGTTWTQMNSSSGWTRRGFHSSVVLPDGSIVLMGGFDSTYNFMNDTWLSINNGAKWTLENTSSGWMGRQYHSSVVLPDGSIVLMGGSGPGGYNGYYNDTWRSVDNGVIWTRMNASSGWAARDEFSSVALPDGSIVLTGGYTGISPNKMNDVWRSIDQGATWTKVNSSAWPVRYGHTSVVLPDGSIMVMGGSGTDIHGLEILYNDLWRSTDKGVTWVQLNPSCGWEGRYGHSSVVTRDGSIVLTGGKLSQTNLASNEAWRFRPVGSSVQSPVHTYTVGGIYNVTLQVYDATGSNSLQKTFYISVNNPTTYAGVFRNSMWYVDWNNNGVWDATDATHIKGPFGQAGDQAVTGYWDGTGASKVGVFRNGMWYVDWNNNGVWDAIDATHIKGPFGQAGDIPVTGDWDGTGASKIGVFRNGMWYVDWNNNGVWDATDAAHIKGPFGMAGDQAVTGDWDGTGASKVGVFRNGMWYVDWNNNGVWDATDAAHIKGPFGQAGDGPVTGKWI
jgi:hypothetical protein